MFCVLLICSFVFVVCHGQVNNGEIRFAGDDPRGGLVEVYLEDTWGTVSNVNLDDNTPKVICRQLGFNGPVKTNSPHHLGPLDAPEWNIQCSGEESSILDCQITKVVLDPVMLDETYLSVDYTGNWGHENDLGVTCSESSEATPLATLVVVDVVILVVVIFFILCFVYLVYRFATRKNGPKTPGHVYEPAPRDNVPPTAQYSKHVVKSGPQPPETEGIDMKDIKNEGANAEVYYEAMKE